MGIWRYGFFGFAQNDAGETDSSTSLRLTGTVTHNVRRYTRLEKRILRCAHNDGLGSVCVRLVLGLTTVLTISRIFDSGMDGDKTGKEQL